MACGVHEKGDGEDRRSEGVRGSFILGLLTPRITPTIHIRKISMACSI